MTDIRFYHLQTKTLEQALPELLAKALAVGHRIVVRCRDQAHVEALNDHLWTFAPDSFLPHGSAKDGQGDRQPIWLTDGADNPNGAGILMIAGGDAGEDCDSFTMVCDIFDGNDDAALAAARTRWKDCTAKGNAATYWQQTDKGWEKKA